MSFQTINITTFLQRAQQMLQQNQTLINPNKSQSLVTNILLQAPPINQSPNKSVIPIIYIDYSKNPFPRTQNIGKSFLNTAPPKFYTIEFYTVIIARGINMQAANTNVQLISSIVRDVYQKNLRMTNADGTDPICSTNEVQAIPFVLRSDTPNIQAINVICRPEVPVQL